MTKRSGLDNFRAATSAVPRSSDPAPATAAGPATSEPPVVGTPRPFQPRPNDLQPPRQFPRQALAWFLGAGAIVLLALVSLAGLTSLVRPTTSWLEALGAFGGLALAAWGLVHYLRPTPALIGYTGLGAALVLALFTYGLSNSVVINGKVYWSDSQVARAYTLSTQLNSAIATIQNYDVLLTYSVPEARLHLSEYTSAIATIQGLYTYWGKYPHARLAFEPGFVDVVNYVGAAAAADAVSTSIGSGALVDKQSYVNNSIVDSTLVTTITNERASVISDLQAAQVDLNAIATKYHFPSATQVHE